LSTSCCLCYRRQNISELYSSPANQNQKMADNLPIAAADEGASSTCPANEYKSKT